MSNILDYTYKLYDSTLRNLQNLLQMWLFKNVSVAWLK